MSRFQTTRWSLLLRARAEGPLAGPALEGLCRLYRPPVLAFIRSRGYPPAHAEDLTQAFFEQFLRLRPDHAADPTRGRFRSYLLAVLRNFLLNQQASATAAKRGGGQTAQALEDTPEEVLVAADSDHPEQAFERAWAQGVLEKALAELSEEAAEAGKRTLFEALRPFLLQTPDREAYDELAKRLGMRRNTLAVAVHRLRTRLRAVVLDVLAEGVSAQAELDAELAALQSVLRGRTSR